VIAATALILLAAFGVQRLAGGTRGRSRYLVGALLVAVVMVDLRFTVDLVDYYPEAPAYYARVEPGAVLAEFPLGREIDYMYFSTRHWAALLTGYSGFIPEDPELRAGLEEFPASRAIELMKLRGATHLTYTCAFERSVTRCEHNLAQLARNDRLALVAAEKWQGAPAHLYRIK
jgi:hypothetical protein